MAEYRATPRGRSGAAARADDRRNVLLVLLCSGMSAGCAGVWWSDEQLRAALRGNTEADDHYGPVMRDVIVSLPVLLAELLAAGLVESRPSQRRV